MRGATSTLMTAVGLIALVVVAVTGLASLLARSDSGAQPLEGLVAVSRVVDVSTADVEVERWFPAEEGRGAVPVEVDVIEIPLDTAHIVDVYATLDPVVAPFEVARLVTETPPLGDLLESERLVIVVWPRPTTTAERSVAYRASLIALDGSGEVAAADWEGEERDLIARLLEWGRAEGLSPAETLAATVRALVGRGEAYEDEILAIVEDR